MGKLKCKKKKNINKIFSKTVLSSPIFEHRLIANDDLYKDELHNTVKILFKHEILSHKN